MNQLLLLLPPNTAPLLPDMLADRQHLAYHAFASQPPEYLQYLALVKCRRDGQLLNALSELTRMKEVAVVSRVKRGLLELGPGQPLKPPKPQEKDVKQDMKEWEEQNEFIEDTTSIQDQVQWVLNNVDLPLSIYKRSDKYWSGDNPKTLQVKRYIKQLHQKQAQWKAAIDNQKLSKAQKQEQKLAQEREKNEIVQIKKQQQRRLEIQQRIHQMQESQKQRGRSLSESLQFMQKRGVPLFKKIQNDFTTKHQLPVLEDRQNKLRQLRMIKRSVDLTEITEHQKRIASLKEGHASKTITNEPLAVSFKSRYHSQYGKSHRTIDEQDTSPQAVFEKMKRYAQDVRQNHKPTVDEVLASQVESRVKELQVRRRRRKQKQSKKRRDSDDSDSDEPQQPSEESQPTPEPSSEEENDGDSDDDLQTKPKKDDQYQPTVQERYKMGLQYLKHMRALRKKVKEQNQKDPDNSQIKAKIPRYKDYLHELTSGNAPVTTLGSARQSTAGSSLTRMGANLGSHNVTAGTPSAVFPSRYLNFSNQGDPAALDQQLARLQQKIQYQEELLKVRRGKKEEKVIRKVEIDHVVIESIKARLAAMKGDQ